MEIEWSIILFPQIWAIQVYISHHFGLEAGTFLTMDKAFIITVIISDNT